MRTHQVNPGVNRPGVNRNVRRIARVAAIGATGVAAGVTIGAAAAGVLGWKLFRSATRPDNWNGKVVVITGGSRGLGLALAQEAARHGARLAICARDQQELEAARRQIGIQAEVGTYICDVSNYDEVVSWINSVRSDFGQIDVLINNAGQISVGPLESQTLTDFQEALDVMYWGVVYPTLAVLPHMKARSLGRSPTSHRSEARSLYLICCLIARPSSRLSAFPKDCTPNSQSPASTSLPSFPDSCARDRTSMLSSKAITAESSPGSRSAQRCPSFPSAPRAQRAESSAPSAIIALR